MIIFNKALLTILLTTLVTTDDNSLTVPTYLDKIEISTEEYSGLHTTICSLENELNLLQDASKEENPITITSNGKFGSVSDYHREVFAYMKEKLKCPKASYALALHESGNFSSPFFKRSNNMFCMGLNKRGFYDFKVYNGGDRNYKCGYNSWKSAIDDMAVWQAGHLSRGKLNISSDEAYIKSLKTVGYARDTAHSAKVLDIYIDLFNNETNGYKKDKTP